MPHSTHEGQRGALALRLARNAAVAVGLIGIALGIGAAGYQALRAGSILTGGQRGLERAD